MKYGKQLSWLVTRMLAAALGALSAYLMSPGQFGMGRQIAVLIPAMLAGMILGCDLSRRNKSD